MGPQVLIIISSLCIPGICLSLFSYDIDTKYHAKQPLTWRVPVLGGLEC